MCYVFIRTSETVLCCSGTQQSVVNSDDDQQAAAAAAELYISESEQSDSESMIVDSCPIQCTTSQTASHVSNVKPPSASDEMYVVDVVVPSLPPDVNFNSSSSYTYISDDKVHIDTTSSLRRPALSHRNASDVVDGHETLAVDADIDIVTHDHETLAVGADIVRSNAVSMVDDFRSRSDETSARDSVPAADKVLGTVYQSELINDVYSSHSDVLFTSNTAVDIHRDRGSTDDVYVSISRDSGVADEEIYSNSHDVLSTGVTVLSGDNIVSNDDHDDDDDDVVVTDGEAGLNAYGIDDQQCELNEVISTAADGTSISHAGAVETSADTLKQDACVDENDEIYSEQDDVRDLGPTPDVSVPPSMAKIEAQIVDSSPKPHYTEVVIETVHTESVETVLLDNSNSRLSLPNQLSSEIATAVDINPTSLEPVDDENKDLNKEMMDVTENQLDELAAGRAFPQSDTAAGPSNAAVETVQQDVEADGKQSQTDKLEPSSADTDSGTQHLTKSPTGASWLCLLLSIVTSDLFWVFYAHLLWNFYLFFSNIVSRS